MPSLLAVSLCKTSPSIICFADLSPVTNTSQSLAKAQIFRARLHSYYNNVPTHEPNQHSHNTYQGECSEKLSFPDTFEEFENILLSPNTANIF